MLELYRYALRKFLKYGVFQSKLVMLSIVVFTNIITNSSDKSWTSLRGEKQMNYKDT